MRIRSDRLEFLARVVALALAGALLPGCSYLAPKKARVENRLLEESRVLTTAVVDTLNTPSGTDRDARTEVALRLATQDQRLEGLPVTPLDVRPLLEEAELRRKDEAARTPESAPSQGGGGENRVAGPTSASVDLPGPATRALEKRFEAQNQLLGRQRQLARQLEEMGAQKEQERNARISRWSRWLSFGGLGVGGLVALIVFVPATVPVLGRLLAWVVGKLPGLAGALGVVSTRAFDAVVRGVERFKQERAASNPPSDAQAPHAAPAGPAQPQDQGSAQLLGHLSRELGAEHKALVRERRLKVELEPS